MSQEHGLKWLSILEFAREKSLSISTIRRHIKKGIVKSKLVEGKYFILIDRDERYNELEKNSGLLAENKFLKNEILRLEEEINELKMLIQVYEKTQYNTDLNDFIPEIPKC